MEESLLKISYKYDEKLVKKANNEMFLKYIVFYPKRSTFLILLFSLLALYFFSLYISSQSNKLSYLLFAIFSIIYPIVLIRVVLLIQTRSLIKAFRNFNQISLLFTKDHLYKTIDDSVSQKISYDLFKNKLLETKNFYYLLSNINQNNLTFIPKSAISDHSNFKELFLSLTKTK